MPGYEPGYYDKGGRYIYYDDEDEMMKNNMSIMILNYENKDYKTEHYDKIVTFIDIFIDNIDDIKSFY